jgi:hypothetical protein
MLRYKLIIFQTVTGTLLTLLLALLPGHNLLADDNNQFGSYQTLSDSQLDTLIAPIALYPDALLIQTLQAAQYPDQITSAATWLRMNSDMSQIQGQLWNPSVTAIAYYPNIINMLYQQGGWCAQLGQAYLNQSSDVLRAVQRLRLQAQSQGNLTNTPQQSIVAQGNSIQILPADPATLYVPQYDPTVVYSQPSAGYAAPLVGFGTGVAVSNNMNTSSVDWGSQSVVYHGYPNTYYQNGAATTAYGVGANGYGEAYHAQGTGMYGNQYNSAAAAGRTWDGGAYAGTANTNQWANGAQTGSYSAVAAGPNGSANARGWGYQNGTDSVGALSKTVDTSQGVYNIHGTGATNGTDGTASVTATGVNKDGEYDSRTWTGGNGESTYANRSGSMFSGAESGGYASAYSNRGMSSRYGGGGFESGGFSGGGRFRR